MKPIRNKEVLQSYILTTSKYDFSVFEKRFLYRLVELGQSSLEGKSFKEGCYKITPILDKYKEITLPYSCLLNGADDKNHALIKKAVVSLQKKLITYEDKDKIESFAIVLSSTINKNKAVFSCLLHPRIWDCILNFSRGYRKYELKTAMLFESVYSMRFYEMLTNQKYPLTYTISDLKKMFGIEGKYKNVNDFIRSVIDPAKKELDIKSPFGFEYKANKEGRKYVSFTFYPYVIAKNQDENVEIIKINKQLCPSYYLDKETREYLINNFSFDQKEIKLNRPLFEKAMKFIPNLSDFLRKIAPKANRANNPKGYVINAIKSELQTFSNPYSSNDMANQMIIDMANKMTKR